MGVGGNMAARISEHWDTVPQVEAVNEHAPQALVSLLGSMKPKSILFSVRMLRDNGKTRRFLCSPRTRKCPVVVYNLVVPQEPQALIGEALAKWLYYWVCSWFRWWDLVVNSRRTWTAEWDSVQKKKKKEGERKETDLFGKTAVCRIQNRMLEKLFSSVWWCGTLAGVNTVLI